jgi:hypothetical protein
MMVEAARSTGPATPHDAMAAIGEVLALEAAVDKAVEFAAGILPRPLSSSQPTTRRRPGP